MVFPGSQSPASKPDSDSSEHLLELPLSVLTPRRVDAGGLRRFGRGHRPELPPTTLASNLASNLGSATTGHGESKSAASDKAEESHHRLVLVYIGGAILFQLLLLLPGISVFRTPLRMFPFAASIALTFFPPRRVVRGHKMHPSVPAAIVVLIIVAFGLLNQETEGMLSGVATVMFYAAILSPLIWVGRLQLSERGFVMIVMLLWSFNALSSAVGVLQVSYPGQFLPAVSTLIKDQQEATGGELKINLANGKEMQRPFGLTDVPGGASGSGIAAFIFGLGLLSATRRPWLMALYAVGMSAGLFIIYLCQVRVALVACFIAAIGYVALLAWRGHFRLLSRVLVTLSVIITFSTIAAFIIGGGETANRVLSLIADDPTSVYYGNRGLYLDTTFRYYLPMFPVGAGLGRYGMMATYFAADHGVSAKSLWAEIQWSAWVYDGGWLMIFGYPIAIIIALVVTLRISLDRKLETLAGWGTILSAYNISAIAITFSYCLFMSQSGLEFWMLNAALFAAYQVQRRTMKSVIPEGFEVLPNVWRPGVAISAPVIDESSSPFAAGWNGGGNGGRNKLRGQSPGQGPKPTIPALLDRREEASGHEARP